MEKVCDPILALQEGVKSLSKSGDYSDLEIVCGEDTYAVHKAILCPRSDFFRAAVNFGKKAADNRIDLSEDDPAVIKLMINYFYELDYEVKSDSKMPHVGLEFKTDASECSANEIQCRIEILKFLDNCSEDTLRSLTGSFQTYNIDIDHPVKTSEAFEILDCAKKHFPVTGSEQQWQNEVFVDNLILHAKVYAIAHKYFIRGLGPLSLQKFKQSLPDLLLFRGFMRMIDVVYTTTADEDDGLRIIVAEWVEDIISVVGMIPIIEEKLKEYPYLGFHLMKSYYPDPTD